MSQITRTWLAFAAIGTALIHLALVISSPLPVGIVLTLVGLAELVWGVAAMAGTRLLAPRIALAGAVAPIVLWSIVLLVAVESSDSAVAEPLRFLPLAIAAVLELFAAGVLAVHIRRENDGDRPAPVTPTAGKYLLSLFIGAFAVALLTTPALAATEAGQFAQPHGQHGVVVEDGGHGGH